MYWKYSLSLTLLVFCFLMGVTACGPQTNVSSSTPSTIMTASTVAIQQPTATPVRNNQNWQTYQSSFFTIHYPKNWVGDTIPQGPNNGIYTQQMEFRPSPTSPISFTISVLYSGEMLPDTMLDNDSLFKSCKIGSQSKVLVDGMLWSTATGETQGTQLAPAKIEIAYANHMHPYRIFFSTPPNQFVAYSATLNAMFQSFQEG